MGVIRPLYLAGVYGGWSGVARRIFLCCFLLRFYWSLAGGPGRSVGGTGYDNEKCVMSIKLRYER